MSSNNDKNARTIASYVLAGQPVPKEAVEELIKDMCAQYRKERLKPEQSKMSVGKI